MNPQPWSVRNAALVGFGLGAIFYPLRALLVGEALPSGATAALSASAGAGLGGMFIFAAAALLHNIAQTRSK